MLGAKQSSEKKSEGRKSIGLFILFLLGTVSLVLSWQSDVTAFFIFFAFVPVFILFDQRSFAYDEKVLVIILAFLFVFISAYVTTYWIRNVNPPAHFTVALLRALTMMLPFTVAFIFLFQARKRHNTPILAFVISWLIMEVLHDLNILGMSYGNLGHVLAAYPGMIQWYSITGAIGGTAWIFLVNYTLFLLIYPLLPKAMHFFAMNGESAKGPKAAAVTKITTTSLLALSVALPILISLISYRSLAKTTATNINVIAIHTSMDVYDFKYEVKPEVLLEHYLRNSKSIREADHSKSIKETEPSNASSDPVISPINIYFWPENALTGDLFVDSLEKSNTVATIRRELLQTPRDMVISGAIVNQVVEPPVPGSYRPRIMHNKEKDYYFKRFNAALYIRTDVPPRMKVKKRLVPITEVIPVNKIFAPLVSMIPNLEDLNFSPANNTYEPFEFAEGKYRTSPVICYGSVFSSLTAGEVKHTGSDFLALILNEGWMKNRKANRHFNWFAICRAVENRRFLVKSSNEGISAFIDSKGNVIDYLSGSTNGAIKTTLRVNDQQTFYTRFHKFILLGILIAGGIILIILGYNKIE